MTLTYEEIIDIMDANAGYLSMDTPENLYKFLNSIDTNYRGSIVEFCYNDLKYPIVAKLEKIPAYLFLDCEPIFSTWTASSHVIQIDMSAFKFCRFGTIDLSKAKITELGEGAFSFSSIKNVVLPEGLKKIGMNTFRSSDIEEVYIPSTVEFIGEKSFVGCKHLKKVHLCRDSIEQNKLKITQDDLNIIKPKVALY